MAEATFKIITTEITLTTNNTVSSNGLIRLVNIGANASLCSLAFSNGLSYGSFTIRSGETLYVQKNYTDQLSANTNSIVLAVPVKRGSI